MRTTWTRTTTAQAASSERGLVGRIVKTDVLLRTVAFLVRPIWVLLAKAGCILRLHVRVEAHPRTTLQAALQVHSAATPPLGAAERNQLGVG
jgi:hypothetical protein